MVAERLLRARRALRRCDRPARLTKRRRRRGSAGRQSLHDLFKHRANPREVFRYVEPKRNALRAGDPVLERMLTSFYDRFC